MLTRRPAPVITPPVLGEIARLGRETAVYGVSTVLGRALNFLLLPLYTHLLAPAEYGIVATGFAYIGFLNVVYQYGMDQAYLRYAAQAGATRENFATPFWSVAASAAALSAALGFGADALAGPLGVPAWALRLSAWILALDALQTIPFAELRRDHRAWTYAGIKTANIVANILLNGLFVWKRGMGAEGVYWAALGASAVGLVLLVPLLLRQLRPAFDAELWREMLRFALPYVPAGLASMAVQLVDRPILAWLTDDATVGVYQANHRLGVAMMMAVNMFDAAWRPFFLERGKRPEAPALFGRVLTYWVLGGSFAFLALSLFIPELVGLRIAGKPIIHPDYWSGLPVVPIVLFGYLLNGVYLNFLPPVMLGNKTERVAYATAAGALACVAANLALVPAFGMTGAAWAGVAAYAVMAAALFALGRPLLRVDYEVGRLARVAAALGACGAGLWAARGASPEVWLGVRVIALALFPGLLWASGFFSADELEAARRKLLGRASQ